MFVYKIYSENSLKCYIGSSTCRYPCQRMAAHKSQYRGFKQQRYHKFYTIFNLFDEVGMDNCQITILCRSEDKGGLLEMEGSHILNEPNCVNKNVPHFNRRTPSVCPIKAISFNTLD
jgi:hypothetical protein